MTVTVSSDCDVVVLGVGTCGEDLSLRLLSSGLKVVGIEASLVGGECPYWACIPSKMTIRAANALQEARLVNTMAGQTKVQPDWTPVAERIRIEASGGWDDSTAVQRFESHGGRLIHGSGKITGPRTASVGDEQISARVGVVIATGSRPSIPPIDGLADVDYWTTHDVIAAGSLPDSIIVLGGGPIGCELGQMLSRFGVTVSIVEAADRLLPSEEPEASEAIAAAFAAEGIDVRRSDPVRSVRSVGGLITATLSSGSNLTASHLLVATGRQVDLTSLGLESVGLGGGQFIEVDNRMRAGDGLWAIGDVTGKAMFTHVALYQGRIVAADILGERHPPARYDAVPRAIFTDPQVGAVGITEAEARASGRDVVVAVKQLGATFRGFIDRASGVIKLIADRETGALVGATACGPAGGEMLGMLALAVHEGVKLADMRTMIYAFPTFHGAIGEAIGAYGRGIAATLDPSYHGFNALDSAGPDGIWGLR